MNSPTIDSLRCILDLSMRIVCCIATLVVLGGSTWATAATTMSNVNTCDTEWTQVEALPHFPDRLARWRTLAPQCAKTGIYEARLAALLTLVGRYEEAREAVRAGLALDSPYKKQLLSTMAGISLNTGQLSEAQREFQALIAAYPDYFDGYCGMGALMLMERKLPEAVRYLSEAARRQQAWIVYRHLTIAYFGLHQYRQAVEAFDRAYRLNPNVVADKDAIDAATRSLIVLGNYRAADGAIKLLLGANPTASADPEIQQTERTIQEKLQAENQK